jgi:hypothetical protein
MIIHSTIAALAILLAACGGHDDQERRAAPATTSAPATDHSAHADHAAPAAATTAHDHAAMQSTRATDHSAHVHHGATAIPSAPSPPPTRTDGATSLEPDEFDAPSPLAVAEAKKAAGGASDPHAHHRQPPNDNQQPAYVCPMHPEVTSTMPGKCPKCGMSLVIKKDGP